MAATSAELLQAAIALLPQAAKDYKTALESGRVYRVIKRHDKPFDFANATDDCFLWMKATKKQRLGKIHETYRPTSRP